MRDLTAFMSHLYSEIPSASEPFSGLYGNLEVVLAKGSISAFQGSLCIGHFWNTQSNPYFAWNDCGTSKLSKLQFCVLVTEIRQIMNYNNILQCF